MNSKYYAWRVERYIAIPRSSQTPVIAAAEIRAEKRNLPLAKTTAVTTRAKR
jgi:hypothetical protein